MVLPSVPLVDIGRGGATALCEAHRASAIALLGEALGTVPLLPLIARFVDPVSRSWLARHENPYLGEIDAIARLLGSAGVYFLNVVYEWACSTSAGPDPDGAGMRLIRILDWGLKGTGRYGVIARHETDAGPFYNATWPGYAGVVTAMAPGRFSAAINQAPRIAEVGVRWADEAVARWRMLRRDSGLPATHLLRRVFEEAVDYEAALAMLTDGRIAIAMPAIFAVAGTGHGEAAVVEAIGRQRRLHRAQADAGYIIGVANSWLSEDLTGFPRSHALTRARGESPAENNRRRRALVCDLQRGAFSGGGDLPVPVLNAHTVMAATANAASGVFDIDMMDCAYGASIPRVVARRALQNCA